MYLMINKNYLRFSPYVYWMYPSLCVIAFSCSFSYLGAKAQSTARSRRRLHKSYCASLLHCAFRLLGEKSSIFCYQGASLCGTSSPHQWNIQRQRANCSRSTQMSSSRVNFKHSSTTPEMVQIVRLREVGRWYRCRRLPMLL
uniref:Uncharacterized protein n=1 Tax=Leishmania guyanensis TaxID=5670 RepID=A0A1E1IWF5_LEIGU|nr:Hypothetical protein BN36_2231220 [Leishmania guyanensis]